MDKAVITFSAENTVTIFFMVVGVSAVLALALRLVRPKAS